MNSLEQDALCLEIVEEIRCLSALTKVVGTEPVKNPSIKRGSTATSGELWMPRLNKVVSYGSSVERDFLLTCRLDHPIIDIVSQPFAILYSHDGKQVSRYTPDFLVQRDLRHYPSQFETGEGENEWLLVEVKRVQDFLRSTPSDVIRLGALNAWQIEGPSRAATFAFDTMLGTTLGERLTYFGRLAAEKAPLKSREAVHLVKSGRARTYGDVLLELQASGSSIDEAIRALNISIALGWLSYRAMRLPQPSDILETWHEVERLHTKGDATRA